jgi:hypothetical protein
MERLKLIALIAILDKDPINVKISIDIFKKYILPRKSSIKYVDLEKEEKNTYYRISGINKDLYFLYSILKETTNEQIKKKYQPDKIFDNVIFAPCDSNNNSFKMFLPCEELDNFCETYSALLHKNVDLIIIHNSIEKKSSTQIFFDRIKYYHETHDLL